MDFKKKSCLSKIYTFTSRKLMSLLKNEIIYRHWWWEIAATEVIRWFCWFCACFVPWEGKVATNQCKVVLSDHCHPVMKHFYSLGSGCKRTPIHRARGGGHWMVYEDENYLNDTPLHTPDLSSCENFKKEVFCSCFYVTSVLVACFYTFISVDTSGNLESTATDTTGHVVNTVL